uniref:Uncharacterized protein n=1 Tax=Nelumbo nucifera TaxID=4432 RepID=A0A822XSL7_NELNU|nr:TPA_asm: hypothetical protein HUJ06_021921 [Nelumbo nucifera]
MSAGKGIQKLRCADECALMMDKFFDLSF